MDRSILTWSCNSGKSANSSWLTKRTEVPEHTIWSLDPTRFGRGPSLPDPAILEKELQAVVAAKKRRRRESEFGFVATDLVDFAQLFSGYTLGQLFHNAVLQMPHSSGSVDPGTVPLSPRLAFRLMHAAEWLGEEGTANLRGHRVRLAQARRPL